jgi:uncharacterized membrane protein (Fun14 family)
MQGYATGYALRVVGQMAAFAVGSVFMLVQVALSFDISRASEHIFPSTMLVDTDA